MKKMIIIAVVVAVIGVSFYFMHTHIKKENTKEMLVAETKEALASENKKLSALKEDFIKIMSDKYPTVDFSFMIKNLDTGAFIVHNNKEMRSASLIKLFVAEAVYKKADAGEYTLTKEKKADMELMLAQSNNEAVNRFIDDFGGENSLRKITDDNEINKIIKEHGYLKTELQHKMYDEEPPGKPMGYKNITSVEDVTALLEKLYKKELFSEPYNSQMMEILKSQQRRTKIPARITEKYSDITVANKTGELFAVDNDAAVIMGKNFNLSFVLMTDNIPLKEDGDMDLELKKEVWDTISKLGLMLVEAYR